MNPTLAAVSALLADGLYVSGGVILLIVVVIVLFLVLRGR